MHDPTPSGVHRSRRGATVIGGFAVLAWATLAPLTAAAGDIPPFQLLSFTFGIAFLCGSTWLLVSGGWMRVRRSLAQPSGYWLLGVSALFGYHALYFVALSLAPPAEASLVAYLWPLLIVLMAPSDGDARRGRLIQLAGAILGFTGVAILLFSREAEDTAAATRLYGLLAAGGCAVIWSSYSVLNRRFGQVPSDTMVGICGAVALLGFAAHLLLGDSMVRPGTSQWIAIVGLGVGPVGLAFLAWDFGTKHGELALLGTLSYAAPVLSMLLLIALGFAEPGASLLLACMLVVGGAWIAAAATRKPARSSEGSHTSPENGFRA